MVRQQLVEGEIYELEGKKVVFAYIGATGKAIVHPPGEPDMQSASAVDPHDLQKATYTRE